MKLGEGRYSIGRNLYMPKAVSEALGISLNDMVEFHTDGKRIYLVKQRKRGG